MVDQAPTKGEVDALRARSDDRPEPEEDNDGTEPEGENMEP